jgi:hypothetical protein
MSLNLTIASGNLVNNGVQINSIQFERSFVYANPGTGEYYQFPEKTVVTVGLDINGKPLQCPADVALIALQPPGTQTAMYADGNGFAFIRS